MKTRKAPRKKTGSTQRTARAVAPKKAAKSRARRAAAGGAAAGRAATRRASASRSSAARAPASGTSAPHAVALPAECLIASAADLRTTLLNRLSESGNVQIDASAVQRIDTASLQLLAAFARDRRAGGLSVEWLDLPACLTDAAALLDLTNTLGFGVAA